MVSWRSSAASVRRWPTRQLPERTLLRGIRLATSRTVEQDPQYAIRLLVDAAIRALSPAINDPTTAVQALDQIEDLLRRLGGRQLDHGQAFDPLGMLRLTFLVPTWEDYLALSFDEIRQYGATGQRAARAAGRSLTVIPSTPAAPLFAHHRSHCRRYVFRRTDYLHQVLRHCRTFAFVRRRDRLHRLAPFRVRGFHPFDFRWYDGCEPRLWGSPTRSSSRRGARSCAGTSIT